MMIGCARVSKADGWQSTDLQRDTLLAAGVDPSKLYQDHASGKKEDRLSWDLRHLVNTVHNLTERGIEFKILTGEGAAIDTPPRANLSSVSSPL